MHAAPTSLSVVHGRAPGAPRVQANRWSLHARFPCRLGGGLLRWLSIHLLNLLAIVLLLLLLHCSSLVASHARCTVNILAGWWPTLLPWYLTGRLSPPVLQPC